MDVERKSSKAAERAAEGLREATARDEAKSESKMGHDPLRAKNALRAPMEKAQKKRKKGKFKQQTQRGVSLDGLRNDEVEAPEVSFGPTNGAGGGAPASDLYFAS